MKNMKSWYELLVSEMAGHNETFKDVEKSTLRENQLRQKFDGGYGGTNGKPFTLWTKSRVYFPVQYDGAEWVSSVPRNPCDEVTEHIGG